jgi:hypothetical protein
MRIAVCKKCAAPFACRSGAKGIYCGPECAKVTNRRHGLSETPEYQVWVNMRSRCLRQTDPAFPSYGGRGIQICERWGLFENFLADMGTRPTKDHSLERVNNDGNYEPSNCKWATWLEQGRNRRGTYTAEEDRKLREAITLGYSYRQMAAHVGKTIGSVQGRALRLGLGSGQPPTPRKRSVDPLQDSREVGS